MAMVYPPYGAANANVVRVAPASGTHVSSTDYDEILEELEDLEAIRAYDAAMSLADEERPLEDAIAEIEFFR